MEALVSKKRSLELGNMLKLFVVLNWVMLSFFLCGMLLIWFDLHLGVICHAFYFWLLDSQVFRGSWGLSIIDKQTSKFDHIHITSVQKKHNTNMKEIPSLILVHWSCVCVSFVQHNQLCLVTCPNVGILYSLFIQNLALYMSSKLI
jgi:hypothetical protein